MTETPLAALRYELARRDLQGFIVPRADEHLGEYVPASAERLAWLTGFTGSAGLAVVLADKAAVFTDGRYVLQLASQSDAAAWERLHVTDKPPAVWAKEHVPEGARIGFDPWLISEEGLANYTKAGLAMTPVDSNPIDAVWRDRPPAPHAPAMPHPLSLAGRSAEDKRQDIAALLRDAKQDAAVLSDPASIAWLFNIRGGDVPFTPFALGFGLIHADGGTELFMDPVKLPDVTRTWLGNAVSVAGRRRPARGARAIGGQDGARRSVRLARLVRGTVARGRRERRCRSRSVPVAESAQERRRTARQPRRPYARRGGDVPVPALAVGKRSGRA